jgi:lipid A disaccharide synthetase
MSGAISDIEVNRRMEVSRLLNSFTKIAQSFLKNISELELLVPSDSF